MLSSVSRKRDELVSTKLELSIGLLVLAAKGWRKSGGPIKNLELVQKLYEAYYSYAGEVKLVWVRGHVGHEGNELADEWANKAREGARL